MRSQPEAGNEGDLVTLSYRDYFPVCLVYCHRGLGCSVLAVVEVAVVVRRCLARTSVRIGELHTGYLDWTEEACQSCSGVYPS